MDALKNSILTAALPLIPFEGWTPRALAQAAQSIGFTRFDVHRAFPQGPVEAIRYFSSEADARMLETLRRDYALSTMKIRERIATAVMVRLRQQAPHREAVRRAIGFMALPWNIPAGTQMLYRTVDAIWREAGDTSTDYNFYTKRLLLSQVLSSTVQVWLSDRTEALSETEAFLRRRIEAVMQIEKMKAKMRQGIKDVKAWLPI